MEYEVLWGDGPLGLTLRPDLGEDMPPVVGRITRQDSAAALAKVAVGDMLVSINGVDTARQGYDHVVDLLQKIPRPATLRFRVPRQLTPQRSMRSMARTSAGVSAQLASTASTASTSSSLSSTSSRGRHEQYTVVWMEGPLGMILRPDDDDVHVPCIRKITGKGAGTGMDRAAVGDVLVAVNGQETKSLGFRSTISLLKTIRKPAVLKFKRMNRRISRQRSSRDNTMLHNGGTSASMTLPGTSSSLSGAPAGLQSAGIPHDLGAYDIVWREGDLGLKLKPGHRDIPVLSKLTGKGTASGLQNANVGDELVSVNGVLVEGQSYHDTLRMLKHSQKPAVLRFRPGRDRRASLMSIASTRSNPSTTREVQKARSGHVPIYDTGRAPSSRDHSGERKKKKRIPLELARELVAASLGIELEYARFAGLPILQIQEGTHEAHLLRVEAKNCITAKHDKSRNGVPPKEALLRAEQEARVLQEALEKVKNQAKKYEQLLEHQKRDAVLAPAIRNKSEEIIGKQNNVIAELSGVIAGFKRDSYSEADIVPMKIEDQEKYRQDLMDDLQNVMNIPVVVPSTKYCAECGATEKESKLDLDDDGQYYCKDCWDNFLSTTNGAEGIPVEAPPSPPTEAAAPPAAITPPATPPAPTLVKSESVSSSSARLSRMSSSAVDREEEERNARKEAEQKLLEIKELTRTGSMRSIERTSSMNPADRTRRERRGLEELAQALLEEEERAKAEGNLALAKKLSAQRARTLAEAKAEQGASPFSSMRNLLDGTDTELGRSKRNGNGSNSFDGSTKTAPSSDIALPPVSLKRAVTLDGPPFSSTADDVPPAVVPAETETKALTPTSAPASPEKSRANDYDDVNSDDEADDQVEMSDTEADVLREVEDRNMALAKQLGEAHSVIERARMSIMLSGDDDGEDFGADPIFTDEQIQLFKKLTSQEEERTSTVDRLHPDEESDSDSDGSVAPGEEDEDDDGVWI
ncbi:hypothetical protein ATCC90586_000064 [Pythium insidiosum]|nr:hypothetical protein ATCC90586_000064 [Pythium insidiosum]